MPHNTKAKIKAYKRKWYKKNKERILNQQKEYNSNGVRQAIDARRRDKAIIEKREYRKKIKEKEFKRFLSNMKYERTEARKEKKRINQRNYMQRKKLKQAA